jgi:tRNA (mo5U34)-methyltransferase
MMPRDAELAKQIHERHWFHTIDLGDGLVTKGDSPSSQVIATSMPDRKGKSVLDIGAWDGKYSFESEMAGASRVVALDHYVWKLDWVARQAYYEDCEQKGVLPDPDMVDRGFLADEGTPGKAGFDLIHRYLNSTVEAVTDDFATMDVSSLGTFDVVLYLGVLYHMVNPIGSLKRLRQVTGEVAVIETAGAVVPGYPDSNLVEFYAGNELHADYGNWFAPSGTALKGMCRAAGFRRVDITAQTAVPLSRRLRIHKPGNYLHRCRIVAHAFP